MAPFCKFYTMLGVICALCDHAQVCHHLFWTLCANCSFANEAFRLLKMLWRDVSWQMGFLKNAIGIFGILSKKCSVLEKRQEMPKTRRQWKFDFGWRVQQTHTLAAFVGISCSKSIKKSFTFLDNCSAMSYYYTNTHLK